jgi:hypothetical protein
LYSIQIPLSLKILLLKCWLSPKTKKTGNSRVKLIDGAGNFFARE